MKRWLLTAIVLLASALPSVSQADPIADFYHGKTLHMVIGYGAGGGYDLYGRLVAQFLGRHIPGNPTIVPQNMPGAGSFKAAEYLYSAAPRDGTYFGSVAQTLAIETATSDKPLLDATQLHYLGRVTSSIDLGVALLSTGLHSFDDARKRELIVGSTGGASTAVLLPLSLNAYAGAKFKLVEGYRGAADVLVALERGEVQVVGATSIPFLAARHPDWLKGGATILYQAALKRSAILPNVPALPELGLTHEGKAVLRGIASTAEIGRSILTTPGVPPERLAALRAAFAAMLKDPDFLAFTKDHNIAVDPASGEEMDAITKETMELPKTVLDKIGKLFHRH